jgi:hypothetical protein
MFAILYETGTSGFYLGYDTTFEDAENRFSRIADDLLENIKSNKKEDFNDFFEMYGIFNASPFCTEYKCYKIATHKNQIIDYKAKSQEQIDTGRANLLRTIFKDVDFVG